MAEETEVPVILDGEPIVTQSDLAMPDSAAAYHPNGGEKRGREETGEAEAVGEENGPSKKPKVEIPVEEEHIAKAAETPAEEEQIAKAAETPAEEEQIAKAAETPAEDKIAKVAEEHIVKAAETPAEEEQIAKAAETPAAEEKIAKVAETPAAEEKIAKVAETPAEEEQIEKVEEMKEGEEEPKDGNVNLGPKNFKSGLDMFNYFIEFLHFWVPNLDINEYEHRVLLDLLKKGHAEYEKKIGEGVRAFQVRYHPTYKSRCFFLVRVDGSSDDFSFRKCVDSILPLPENLKLVSASGGKMGGGHGGGGGWRGRGGGGGGRGRGRRGGGRN